MNEAVLSTSSLKFRWINGQYFEFTLPSGKALLTDPFFDVPGHFQEAWVCHLWIFIQKTSKM